MDIFDIPYYKKLLRISGKISRFEKLCKKTVRKLALSSTNELTFTPEKYEYIRKKITTICDNLKTIDFWIANESGTLTNKEVIIFINYRNKLSRIFDQSISILNICFRNYNLDYYFTKSSTDCVTLSSQPLMTPLHDFDIPVLQQLQILPPSDDKIFRRKLAVASMVVGCIISVILVAVGVGTLTAVAVGLLA